MWTLTFSYVNVTTHLHSSLYLYMYAPIAIYQSPHGVLEIGGGWDHHILKEGTDVVYALWKR